MRLPLSCIEVLYVNNFNHPDDGHLFVGTSEYPFNHQRSSITGQCKWLSASNIGRTEVLVPSFDMASLIPKRSCAFSLSAPLSKIAPTAAISTHGVVVPSFSSSGGGEESVGAEKMKETME
jgi:hypothetical protein